MFCLVRTDASRKPQQGITFLLLDMDSPGISVEPILFVSGEHEVNQVFFDNVRVPRSNRVGAENDGWTVAKYLLEFERGGSGAARMETGLARVKRLARATRLDAGSLADDPAFARKIADSRSRDRVDSVHRVPDPGGAGEGRQSGSRIVDPEKSRRQHGPAHH